MSQDRGHPNHVLGVTFQTQDFLEIVEAAVHIITRLVRTLHQRSLLPTLWMVRAKQMVVMTTYVTIMDWPRIILCTFIIHYGFEQSKVTHMRLYVFAEAVLGTNFKAIIIKYLAFDL